jgi:tyrosyl-tRNA synthetase
MLNLKEQIEIIKRGAVEIIPEEELVKKLEKSIKTNTPLRIKQGFDPTAPDIHLGHTVGLRKLRDFQKLGHQVILIVGDYTGMVGDPSGRSERRPQLSLSQIKKNAETYQKQFFKVVDRKNTEVRFNSEWFSRMNFLEIMHLASRMTLARMLERDDFCKRFKEQAPISLHELFYPLMQGYDSVAIKADVEIGGTEQKFNLLTARQVQEDFGIEPQVILTLPILVGIDGKQRMSKSIGNYIGVAESPKEIFGKIMSIPDELIYSYFELLTDISDEELSNVKKNLEEKKTNPMELKKKLGREIVAIYYNQEKAEIAQKEFEKVFSEKELPDEIPVFRLKYDKPKIWIVKLLTMAGLAESSSHARRLIQQGGVYVDNEKVVDVDLEIPIQGEKLLKVGKRKFLKIKMD